MSIDTIERAHRIMGLLGDVYIEVIEGAESTDEVERAIYEMSKMGLVLLLDRAQTIRAKAEAVEEGSP